MGKVENISAGKPSKNVKGAPSSTAATRAERRERRMEKISKASTVTFTLELPVRKFMDAQAKAAGMNMTHYMQMLVEPHVIDTAPADDALALRLAAKRHVIARVVALATDMDAAGKFDDDFILKVINEAQEEDGFVEQYDLALGGPETAGTRAGDRARTSMNQQIGRVIKKAVGVRSKRTEKGKIARAQVQDAMISTYTLLEKAA